MVSVPHIMRIHEIEDPVGGCSSQMGNQRHVIAHHSRHFGRLARIRVQLKRARSYFTVIIQNQTSAMFLGAEKRLMRIKGSLSAGTVIPHGLSLSEKSAGSIKALGRMDIVPSAQMRPVGHIVKRQ